MKKETKKQLLIGAALVLELLLLLLYLNGRINKLLDSDMSSEMVLGQLLAHAGGVFQLVGGGWNAENIFCSQHSCCLHLFQSATLNLCWWRRAISHMWQLHLRHWP